MKIRNKLLNYYCNFSINNNIWLSILFGTLLISLVFWNRLIRVRLPRDLTQVEWSFLSIIIGSLAALNIGLFIYYLIKIYKIIPSEKSKITTLITSINIYIRSSPLFDTLLNNIKLIIEQHIIYGPHRMYDRFYQRNAKIKSYLNKFVDFMGTILNKYLWELPKGNWALILVYLILFALPQIIPALFFFIEVVIFHHLNHFYKALILLLIPLLANILLFIFKHSLEMRMTFIRKFYTLEHFIEGRFIIKAHIVRESITEAKSKEYDAFLALYKTKENVTNRWIHYQTLYNVVCQIELHQNHYKYYLNLVRSGLYAVGFLIYFMILCDAYSIITSYIIDIICKINNSLFNKSTLILLLLYYIVIIFGNKKLSIFYDYMYRYISVKPFCKYSNNMLDNLLTIYTKQILLWYTLLFGIPYVLPLLIFVIELFYYNQLYYAFVSVYAMVIPQIIHLLLYIIRHDATTSLEYYTKFFSIILDKETNIIHITPKILDDPKDIEKVKSFDMVLVAQWWEYYYDTKDNVHSITIQINLYNKRVFYYISFLLFMLVIVILYIYYEPFKIFGVIFNIQDIEEPFSLTNCTFIQTYQKTDEILTE